MSGLGLEGLTLANMLAFNLVLGASILSPGPAFLLALRSTLIHGRAAGLQVGLGLGLMAAGWTAMALFGLDIVFQLFPALFVTLRVAGALYLLWLAVQIWRSARTPLTQQAPARRGVLAGILVNLGNPKSVVFAASILVTLFPAQLSSADKALIIANHLVLELAFYATLALALSRPSAQRVYLRAKPVFDRIAAALLAALGLRLLLDR